MDTLLRFTLVLGSCLIFFISMPGASAPWLTWVCLVPVGLAIDSQSPARSAFLMWLTVTIWWMTALIALLHALSDFVGLNFSVAALLFFSFCSFMALPYALIGWFAAKSEWMEKKWGLLRISSFHTLVVCLFPSPIPAELAHSLYSSPTFLQFIDITGLSALIFLVSLVNWGFIKIISTYHRSCILDKSSLLGICLLLAATHTYGVWKIDAVNEEIRSNDKRLSIALVQPNLSKSDEIDQLLSMTARAIRDNPQLDLIVWPEMPISFSYIENLEDKKRIDQLMRLIKKPILINSSFVYPDASKGQKQEKQYYNVVHLLNSRGEEAGRHLKQVLVPFFEYLPLRETLPFISDFFPGSFNYISGEKHTILALNKHTHLIPLICYETIFSGVVNTATKSGGDIFINITNDIWLGDSRGSQHHLAVGMFRAIEHRKSWIRVANSGISAAVSPAGEINVNSVMPLFSKGIRLVEADLNKNKTFYSRYGEWFLCVIGFLFFFSVWTSRPKVLLPTHAENS